MDNKIIISYFKKWTKHLSPIEARISVYSHIRDIPYAIVQKFSDPKIGCAGILEENKGTCSPKHYLLGMMFNELGIAVKYTSFLFNWDDPDIKYPDNLRKMAKQMPITPHVVCKAFMENKWVLIDATWDLNLKQLGFPVNESWDGISDTKNAVKPIKQIDHNSLEERLKFAEKIRKKYTINEQETYLKFTKEFNNWLKSVRK